MHLGRAVVSEQNDTGEVGAYVYDTFCNCLGAHTPTLGAESPGGDCRQHEI